MGMIEIFNPSEYRIGLSSSYTGVQGRPLYMELGPSEIKRLTQNELRNWGTGSKSDLAGYVQRGILQVTQITALHIIDDLGNKPAPFGAFDLISACNTADDIRNAYNEHVVSANVHLAPDLVNIEVLAKPTTLVLLTAFIISLQGKFNAHLGLGAATHVVADAWNTTAAPTGTLPQNITALKDLYWKFHQHKRQANPPAGVVLNPNQIITY